MKRQLITLLENSLEIASRITHEVNIRADILPNGERLFCVEVFPNLVKFRCDSKALSWEPSVDHLSDFISINGLSKPLWVDCTPEVFRALLSKEADSHRFVRRGQRSDANTIELVPFCHAGFSIFSKSITVDSVRLVADALIQGPGNGSVGAISIRGNKPVALTISQGCVWVFNEARGQLTIENLGGSVRLWTWESNCWTFTNQPHRG